jgi:GTPase KRas
VVIDGQSCMLEILDTAGQEEYSALSDQWARDGEGFLLVYSISSRLSFTRIAEFYNQICRANELSTSCKIVPSLPIPIMLVGNKSDCITEREVSVQEGHNSAMTLGCEFIEASAKNGISVERVFYDVVRHFRRTEGRKL